MTKIIAYVRVSSDKQDADSQELEIRRYADEKQMTISEVLSIQVSSRKLPLQRRIDEMLEKLNQGDTLIITEISRLGRSTSEVIQLINSLFEQKIRLIAIKQGLDLSAHDMQSKIVITLFSLLSELERDLISIRTKEALASKKAQGQKLGKPKGTIQKSKFDKDLEKIKSYLKDGVSIRRISQNLGYSNHIGLNNYIRSRKVKEQL
jgi:DNA invertase Pin-like site-specific DNA recombinase